MLEGISYCIARHLNSIDYEGRGLRRIRPPRPSGSPPTQEGKKLLSYNHLLAVVDVDALALGRGDGTAQEIVVSMVS